MLPSLPVTALDLAISRARYLHAEATLWLNDFDAQAGAPGAESVTLPEVPVPTLPAPTASEVDASTALQAAMAGTEPPVAPGVAAVSDSAPLTAEQVRPRRTVVLRVARRLAPGEVHYLDHPLFGALLTTRPWDPAAGAANTPDQVQTLPPAGAEETPPPP